MPLFPPPKDSRTGKRCKNHGLQSYEVETVNGKIRLWRRWWSSPSDGSFAPVDALIDPEHETYTVGVREMVARLNNGQRGFESVVSNLKRTAQISMSAEQARLLVEADGRQALKQQREGTIAVAFPVEKCVIPPESQAAPDAPPRTLAEAVTGQTPQTRMYVGVDGVMVPVITETEKMKRRKNILLKRQRSGKRCRPLPPRRKGWTGPYREFKVVEFHDETGRFSHQSLCGEKRTSVGIRIRNEAFRLNFLKADERVSNVDGTSWIRAQLEDSAARLKLDGLGLDYWHFAENVHRCRRKVFGESSPDGQQWATDLADCFKIQGFKTGWEKLVTWRQTLRSKKRQAADKLMNYVSERREMLSYPEFRQRGWQIGSGPTEARCKTTTYRLKAPGCRWDIRNAEAVAALTTLSDSGQWDHYWQLHTKPST